MSAPRAGEAAVLLEARAWLGENHPMLDGRTRLSYLLEGQPGVVLNLAPRTDMDEFS